MDSLTNQYRQIIKKILEEYADFLGNDEQVKVELVLDEKNDRYLLVETGWKNGYRIYGTLLHLDLIDGKVWVDPETVSPLSRADRLDRLRVLLSVSVSTLSLSLVQVTISHCPL